MCFASLYTDRAIFYREEKGFGQKDLALSVGVQKMVRSDLASSGVMFSLDIETGFEKVVVINSTWGLGENIVQGLVTPDEHIVYKPLLERKDIVPIVDKNLGDKPMALAHFEKIEDKETQMKISSLTQGYEIKPEHFVDLLSRGIAKIACSQYPHPVIVRMSDFKTNEYANLIGGDVFEPKEENPMLGSRGASRYYSPKYRDGFDLECAAIKRVREVIGLDNVLIMVPFCRTLEEAKLVLDVLKENGLSRDHLQVYVMAEIPSNIILAERFADLFDGFSIGSNDLTQLTLGVDRDSSELADLFSEHDQAVKQQIQDLIEVAHKKGRKVGICGQGPSDDLEFAAFLVQCGIDSLSLTPDSFIQTVHQVSKIEKDKK